MNKTNERTLIPNNMSEKKKTRGKKYLNNNSDDITKWEEILYNNEKKTRFICPVIIYVFNGSLPHSLDVRIFFLLFLFYAFLLCTLIFLFIFYGAY